MTLLKDWLLMRVARFLEPMLNDLLFKVSCDYQIRYPDEPHFYPDDPSASDTVITGSANANEWSTEQQVIPASEIDAEGGTAFTVIGSLVGGPEDTVVIFRFMYDGDIVGSGVVRTTGEGVRIRRAGFYFPEIVERVQGEDLNMVIKASAGNADLEIAQTIWCNGSPPEELSI